MSDMKGLARALAKDALDEGQRVAFDLAINVCNQLAAAYEEKGHIQPAIGCRESGKLIEEMRRTMLVVVP